MPNILGHYASHSDCCSVSDSYAISDAGPNSNHAIASNRYAPASNRTWGHVAEITHLAVMVDTGKSVYHREVANFSFRSNVAPNPEVATGATRRLVQLGSRMDHVYVTKIDLVNGFEHRPPTTIVTNGYKYVATYVIKRICYFSKNRNTMPKCTGIKRVIKQSQYFLLPIQSDGVNNNTAVGSGANYYDWHFWYTSNLLKSGYGKVRSSLCFLVPSKL